MSTGLAFSVIVCTYNRAPLLAQLLASLARQQPAPDGDWEVVVVDNNCSDDTPQVVASHATVLPVRRVSETRQGLASARNRGVAASSGSLLLFTDDDVVLHPGWLAAYRAAARDHPGAGFFGGRIRPLWPHGRPAWVRDEGMDLLAGIFGCLDHGTSTRPFAHAEDGPFGASFAVRRALLENLGAFDPEFGRRGDDLGRGEEAEFLRRARAAGHTGIYVGEALSRHRVDPARLRFGALYRYGLASARAHRALVNPRATGSVTGAALYLVRGLGQLARRRGDRFRQCVINAGLQMGLRR